MTETLAERIAGELARAGVKRMFGIPGGGSSLDLIDACDRIGIEFVLTRTEAAGGLMAAVTGEITNTPGVVLVGVGPGVSSVVNAVAYASLERSPLIVFADGPASSRHQRFDQQALFKPLARGSKRLTPETGAADFAELISLALSPPEGPVICELTAPDAGKPGAAMPPAAPAAAKPADADSLAAARALIEKAHRPVLIAGLEARRHADAVRGFAAALGGLVLATYKGSGVVPTGDPMYVGPFTGAAGERKLIADADLVILAGADSIEFIPGAFPSDAPILSLAEAPIDDSRLSPAVTVAGPLGASLAALLPACGKGAWPQGAASERRALVMKAHAPRPGVFDTATAVQILGRRMPAGTRLAVDAGAHMFSTFAHWPASEPFGMVKSNGLSSMGYALPGAVASALAEPERPALGITGDGGLIMCLGDLATLGERKLNAGIVVMNDAALSLIDIKQQRQQRPPRGVRYPAPDFAAIARSFGINAATVGSAAELEAALDTLATPFLIDARVDPAGYGEELERLRG